MSPIPTEQLLMGVTFTSMGLGTMLAPNLVFSQFFSPSWRQLYTPPSPALTLVTRCFGAQATLCGCLILCAKFTRRTYFWFGMAILPFFVFDAMAYKLGAINLAGAGLDALGNVIFTACSVQGYLNRSKAKQNNTKDEDDVD